MMSTIFYQGSDGNINVLGDDELMHFKYIKKVKTGSGYRYLYTPAEVAAYNREIGANINAINPSNVNKNTLKEKYKNLKSVSQKEVKKNQNKVNKGKSIAEKKLKKAKKTIKSEAAGAKRAKSIVKDMFVDEKHKKGDTVNSYYGDGKHYDSKVVTNTRQSKYGYQIYETKTKKKKQKTSKIERGALKLYRATHPYE